MDDKTEAIQGIKTFFVVPELSLFPEEFLKSFFLKGYEAYFLDDDPYCPLEAKIHAMFSIFPQLILFFNIDRPIRGIDWPVFIASLQKEYGDRAMIGVMYHKLNDLEETRRLEKLYLYDIGIICGCVAVEYQRTKNLYLFLNVLAANQANGQRKSLRAVCDKTYKATIPLDRGMLSCVLRDVSVSHFSCTFPEGDPSIPLHEKLVNIQMNLRGVLIKVNAVLCLKRVLGEELIHVFVFRTNDDREGLELDHMSKINEMVFNSLNERITDLLRIEFMEIRSSLSRKNREAGPSIIPFIPPKAAEKKRGRASLPEAETKLESL
mgnify:CR=1 FL=1